MNASIFFNGINFAKRLCAASLCALAAGCFSGGSETSTSAEAARNTKIFVYADEQAKPYTYSTVWLAESDGGQWKAFDSEYYIVGSMRVFSPLGDHTRKMRHAYIFFGADKKWHCVWTFKGDFGKIGHRASEDFIVWKMQTNTDFPNMPEFSKPVVKPANGGYSAYLKAGADFYKIFTADFKTFGAPQKIAAAEYPDEYKKINVSGVERDGVFVDISEEIFAALKAKRARARSDAEIMAMSGKKLADAVAAAPLKAELRANFNASKPISPNLIGVFFEDVNSAADGGLYAEMIENRDFEYPAPAGETPKTWQARGGRNFRLDTSSPIDKNNAAYAVIKSGKDGASLANKGWDGIPLKSGDKYFFSIFAKLNSAGAAPQTLRARLTDGKGAVAAEGEIKVAKNSWQKFELELVPSVSTNAGELELIPQAGGEIAVDMVSLFPEKTFKNRRNGMRKDLAEAVAAIKPKFMRFPGGCLVHGHGVKNFYRWQNTLGALEKRVHNANIWGYHQTMGLGYHEYFQFCEDIGAEPLPVVPAGISCQFKKTMDCVPMDKMPEYIGEIFDLIEWANGAPTTKWGRVRAENGHPEPFGLKYLGVGNEDEINDDYKVRFEMIQRAVQKKHPEITVIGSAGWKVGTPHYYAAWDFGRKINTPILDDHYYSTPEWYIVRQDLYDSYPRGAQKVYLGEYAVLNKKRTNTLETALFAALHLVNVERNADLVIMSSYAPLFGRLKHCQWNPDMIYFDNSSVYLTPDYYTQKIFGNNVGDEYVNSSLKLNCEIPGVAARLKASVVRVKSTGETIVKIVNLLPKEVEISLALPAVKDNSDCAKTVLSGSLEDTKLEPREECIKISGNSKLSVAPNSLTVLRIAKQP